MININNLTIKYPDGNTPISNLTLSIDAGVSVAVMGANGAGKSSLLLALVGILPASLGEITVGGILVNKKNLSALRNKVGLVFQNPDDQLFMTHVYEDVAFGLRNSNISEEEVNKRVLEVLAELHISHLMKCIPSKLSGGEKRSVAIGGILAMRPEIMLFDEPTSFLDPRSRRQLLPLLKGLNVTKIIATHDLDLAEKVCDRVILLKKGSLVAQGSPSEILHNVQLLEDCGLC